MNRLKDLTRSDRLLKKEFLRYFFPAILTSAALSLSEFADSLVVANLLGSRALAVIQLGMPVTLISAGVYILLGVGGSILFAISLGQRDKEMAGRLFAVSLAAAAAVGVLLMVLSMVFFPQFSALLCRDPELSGSFSGYLRMLLLSMPFIITVLTVVSFLPPNGSPGMATAINVIANFVNVGMDFFYIKVLGMGAEGAALATVTGFGVGFVVLAAAMLLKKVKLSFKLPRIKDLALLKDIVVSGAPFSLTQIGYAIKFAISGRIAQAWGGVAGMEALSLCVQALSFAGMFMSAVLEAAAPIMAVLRGQRDYQGEKLVLRNTLVWEVVLSAACVLLFVIFPRNVAAFYKITEPKSLELAVKALWIFTPSLLLRGLYVTGQKHAQILGFKLFPLTISVFDAFAGIIPLCFLMTWIMGIDGLFWAYSITSVLSFLIWILGDLILARRSRGRFSGILLAENDIESDVLADVSLSGSNEDISRLSETVQKLCLGIGMEKKRALMAALAVEEMCIYMRKRVNNDAFFDVLLRSYSDRVEIDFRTIGPGSDPNEDDVSGADENLLLLRSLKGEIKYDVVMGMNCTEIILPKGSES